MKTRLDVSTVFGLLLGFVAVFGSFLLEGGTMGALLLIPAMVIVFGGTIAAAMIGTSTKNMLTVPTLLRLAIFVPTYDVKRAIDDLVRYSSVARRDGLLSLEKDIDRIPEAFMQKFLRYAIDGTDPDMLREITQTELEGIADRHARGAMLFSKMGGYSPTMGIIGTVMGLILVMGNLSNAAELGPSIAVAFMATFYGVSSANLIMLPIGKKMALVAKEETQIGLVIVEGLVSIQSGDNPRVVQEKLKSYIDEGMWAQLRVKAPAKEAK